MSFRLRKGLRWKKPRPTLTELKNEADTWLRVIAILLGILIAYGVVGRMEYDDLVLSEHDQYQQAVLACLNHGAIVFDHEAFECRANSIGDVR